MTSIVRTLDDLLIDAPAADARVVMPVGSGDASSVELTSMTLDSRSVTPGALFCCVPGGSFDGHQFAEEAARLGAVALLVDRELAVALPQIVVSDVRRAMGPIAASLFGHPSLSLTVVGITGTNGKTTTATLMAAIFEAAGMPCGVLGTLTGRHTTPEAPELQRALASFRDSGMRAVVMEVSSHGLALHRVDGTRFAAAIFTNLGRDHLDLHGTIERYFAAKAALFEGSLSDVGVVNRDDVYGRLLLDSADIPMLEFSRDDMVDLEVSATRHSYTWRGERIEVALGGHFNAMNSLAAATTAASLGIPLHSIVTGLRGASNVPGRFEAVLAGQPFDVIVDYAHTPDGLREVLRAARQATIGALTVVFGCGGDRDRDKRPLMGAVAAELADRVVITSDNPRSEDPLDIINAIMEGVHDDYRHRIVMEPDRRRALATAFADARVGDVVVIAGKGHETTQTIGSEVLPFDDRAVARALLEARP